MTPYAARMRDALQQRSPEGNDQRSTNFIREMQLTMPLSPQVEVLQFEIVIRVDGDILAATILKHTLSDAAIGEQTSFMDENIYKLEGSSSGAVHQRDDSRYGQRR